MGMLGTHTRAEARRPDPSACMGKQIQPPSGAERPPLQPRVSSYRFLISWWEGSKMLGGYRVCLYFKQNVRIFPNYIPSIRFQ